MGEENPTGAEPQPEPEPQPASEPDPPAESWPDVMKTVTRSRDPEERD